MINFKNINKSKPFQLFSESYSLAIEKGQKNIESASISSYDIKKREVSSRHVNIKYFIDDKFIFFTNYDSPKSTDFKFHKQISALFFWESINIQIRMKAHIQKTSKTFNQKHFSLRSDSKNILAISSRQSQVISDYKEVVENYNKVKNSGIYNKCPDYWGGYSFKPYEIEFWEGSELRLNKRNMFKKHKSNWNHSILEP